MQDDPGMDILLTIGACVEAHVTPNSPPTETLLYRTKAIRGINRELALGVDKMSISTLSAIVGIIAYDVEIFKHIRYSNTANVLLVSTNGLSKPPSPCLL
jgi:hypothetical protein